MHTSRLIRTLYEQPNLVMLRQINPSESDPSRTADYDPMTKGMHRDIIRLKFTPGPDPGKQDACALDLIIYIDACAMD